MCDEVKRKSDWGGLFGWGAQVKPCGCSGCSVVVHSSCASAVNVGGPHKEQRVQRLGVCWFCGSRARDGAGSDTKLAKGCRSGQEASDGGDGQGGKEEQMGAARKRLRSNSGSSGGGGKGEQQGVKALAKNPRSEAGANAVQSERVQAEASPTDSKKVRGGCRRVVSVGVWTVCGSGCGLWCGAGGFGSGTVERRVDGQLVGSEGEREAGVVGEELPRQGGKWWHVVDGGGTMVREAGRGEGVSKV